MVSDKEKVMVTKESTPAKPVKLSPQGLASRQAAHERKIREFQGGK